MNGIKMYGKPIRVNKATADKKVLEVGATLFIGNLDLTVDEKLLFDTFSSFGTITQTPKIARDPDTNIPKGYGFVAFDSFEASDAAIEAMNGQFLMNKPLSVSYAFKRDGKGERHGDAAGNDTWLILDRTFAGCPSKEIISHSSRRNDATSCSHSSYDGSPHCSYRCSPTHAICQLS
jgi:RNA recognition motif-containing protein